MPDDPPDWIAVDWGTTSLRLYRLDSNGGIAGRRESARGILSVEDGGFAAVLAEAAAGWLDGGRVLMCGMIGSANGWLEAPYADCPAGFGELAAGLAAVPDAPAPTWIVPGVAYHDANGVPDVMRGEETQIFGALDLLDVDEGVFVLPGTHSKWAEVVDGRIVRFETYLTGEAFDVLRRHSILGRLAQEAGDGDGFAAGIAAARSGGPLLHDLFSVRARTLFKQVAPADVADFLSGLLIGHELRDGLAMADGRAVHVIGGAELSRRYLAALELFGAKARAVPGEVSARGLFRIASTMGAAA